MIRHEDVDRIVPDDVEPAAAGALGHIGHHPGVVRFYQRLEHRRPVPAPRFAPGGPDPVHSLGVRMAEDGAQVAERGIAHPVAGAPLPGEHVEAAVRARGDHGVEPGGAARELDRHPASAAVAGDDGGHAAVSDGARRHGGGGDQNVWVGRARGDPGLAVLPRDDPCVGPNRQMGRWALGRRQGPGCAQTAEGQHESHEMLDQWGAWSSMARVEVSLN